MTASPALANLTLDGLEKKLREKYPKTRTLGRRAKVHLVRYCDDFIITGSSKELLENEVRSLVEEFLRERGLELSPEKTRITHIEDGFDFLGQHLRRYHNGKIIISPSKKNVAAFLDKTRRIIKGNAIEGKPSRSVPRGLGRSNPALLLGDNRFITGRPFANSPIPLK